MFQALYNFFSDILYANYDPSSMFGQFIENTGVEVFDTNLIISDYLAILLALVSGFIIVGLCCLFVYKIIKLIGGLIR